MRLSWFFPFSLEGCAVFLRGELTLKPGFSEMKRNGEKNRDREGLEVENFNPESVVASGNFGTVMSEDRERKPVRDSTGGPD
jgi:hypothetical protein